MNPFHRRNKLLSVLGEVAVLCVLAAKARIARMVVVSFEGSPFKVRSAVVEFVAVNMVHGLREAGRRRLQKCLGNEPVERLLSRAKRYDNVSIRLVPASLKQPSDKLAASSVPVDQRPSAATKSTKRRHFVMSLKSLNRLPFFGGHNILRVIDMVPHV